MSEIIDQILAEHAVAEAELEQGANLGPWWTWTQTEFNAWCDGNFMTDAAIDDTTLSAALKKNLKATNLFQRKAGSLLIIARNIFKWLLRNI